ncbi:hypothetical protein STCU_02126 [Strigomonas culicis]|uniref:C2 domain-containing protein n=1 Tax=Strigomonas culicis TaxID=28005 RepID=S9URS9_9TRYP|nr:hypothetical protein STCU_06118 [Strigomonas culicis]EPY33622.1 hypothetical protein STCU_02126 [Strigomonas culicis]|eukprot:EPY26711.1 hypothetical protein STCU_06118 [Strigomonas culicis]
MPVLDISVLNASNIQGVSSEKTFCVYVRLQGQAMRTKTVVGHNGIVVFNERFRFQYRPPRDNLSDDKNRLFVELWVKSTFSQSCVAVAWANMDQDFVQKRQVVLNMTGNFEGKSATVSVSLLPLDFGRSLPTEGPLPYNTVPMQMPPPTNLYNAPAPQPTYPPPLYSQPTPQPLGYSGPAEGVPLQQVASPYTTATYTPQPLPPQQQPNPCQAAPLPPQQHQCEAAPLPPYDASGRAGEGLPPPQYPSTIMRDRRN